MLGIIPAYAGQIRFVIKLVPIVWDHPRIRGTNPTSFVVILISSGSSPHTRDKFTRVISSNWKYRIIPAYAGQIFACDNINDKSQDHPRIRGTNIKFLSSLISHIGSSPHTRDKLLLIPKSDTKTRIIPAYAGQIMGDVLAAESEEDHPRIRGTNLFPPKATDL